jgi:hypothetical protein
VQKQIKGFKWQKNGNVLLKDVVHAESTYSNYSVVRLSDGNYAVLDRSKLRFLVPADSSYSLDYNWKLWFKRGFIVFTKTVYLVRNYYIFNVRTLETITKEKIIHVEASSFLDGKSNYFTIVNEQYQKAIFNSEGDQISDWFDLIKEEGLLTGQSDYYIATKYGKRAIFHKDGKQISNWYDWFYTIGLVDGRSDYYVAEAKGQQAIFHKDGQQITDWYEDVYLEGLVAGESDYYIVEQYFNDVCKKAIFDKDKNQITDWHDFIDTRGLVKGQSPYYMTIENKGKKRIIYIYKAGSKKVMGPFRDVKLLNTKKDSVGFIDDPSKDKIVVVMLNGRSKEITKEEADKFFDQEEYKEV